jgi:hypothetical protein
LKLITEVKTLNKIASMYNKHHYIEVILSKTKNTPPFCLKMTKGKTENKKNHKIITPP